ncbi:AsmA family protein [Belnapia sp. T6]|uniref:AsmA family protein n=1 Tax=Belnapia mucosa TaxID=2804532 RepID=A0ABS1V7S9_9PROT|nr:AsmA family protein [Belnapia mucosa]MBL6457726.1 AsmA family protein [Belnapia mucosa]
MARRWRWILGLGVPLLAIALLVVLFRWDWLIPIVEAQASAKLGRPVTIAHLHVSLGRTTTITAEDLKVGNPPGFEGDAPFAAIPRASIAVDVGAYIKDRSIVIPEIALDRPAVEVIGRADGSNNYSFDLGGGAASDPSSPGPRIGNLRITEGQAHVAIAKLRSDFRVAVATEEQQGGESSITARATGTYAAQPINAELKGGALLNLRDAERPWPIQLSLANGPTKVDLHGTVQDPLKLAGADIRLDIAGPDMALLAPLTGVAIPATTPFRVTGKLDYEAGAFRFSDVQGRLGRSDIGGRFSITPGKERPVLDADISSRRVDLADLGGFIGGTPGRVGTPGQTAQQRQALARAEASPRLLPTAPISIPRLRAADIHLRYRAASIEGRSMPFDSLEVNADIENGVIRLHPVSFGIGRGRLAAEGVLTPLENGALRAQVEFDLRRIDISKLMRAAGAGGAGTLGGVGKLDGAGRSLSELLGNGNGGLTLVTVGGNLSSLLVDLSGLQFGNALLSALGIPARTEIECLIADFTLQRGMLDTRSLLLDTDSYVVTGGGKAGLGRETLDLWLRTSSKHFTIGSLPTPIGIGGTFKNPSILPELGELAVRGGAAVGLGILFPPLALLPTIQLGVGENSSCERLTRRAG